MDDGIFFSEDSPKPSTGNCNVIIGDCIEILRSQQESGTQYDAIITDPPYELNLMGMSWDNLQFYGNYFLIYLN